MARKPSQIQLEKLLRASFDASVDSPFGELIQQLAADIRAGSTHPISLVDRDIDGSTWNLPSTESESGSSLRQFLTSSGVTATIINAVSHSDDVPIPFGAADFPPLHDRLSDFCLILPRLFYEISKELGLKIDFNKVRIEVAWIMLFEHLIRRHCSARYARATIANYLRTLRDAPLDKTIRFGFTTDEGEKEEEWVALYSSIREWSLPALLYAGFDFVPKSEDISRMREALTLATLGDTPTKALNEMEITGYSGKLGTQLRRLFKLADHPGRRKAFVDACHHVANANPRAIPSTLEVNSRISQILEEMRRLLRETQRKNDQVVSLNGINVLPRHSISQQLGLAQCELLEHKFNRFASSIDETERTTKDVFTQLKPPVRLVRPITVKLEDIGLAARNLWLLNRITAGNIQQRTKIQSDMAAGLPNYGIMLMRRRQLGLHERRFEISRCGLPIALSGRHGLSGPILSARRNRALSSLSAALKSRNDEEINIVAKPDQEGQVQDLIRVLGDGRLQKGTSAPDTLTDMQLMSIILAMYYYPDHISLNHLKPLGDRHVVINNIGQIWSHRKKTVRDRYLTPFKKLREKGDWILNGNPDGPSIEAYLPRIQVLIPKIQELIGTTEPMSA